MEQKNEGVRAKVVSIEKTMTSIQSEVSSLEPELTR